MNNLRQLPSGSYNYRKQIDGKQVSLTFDHKPSQREIALALGEAVTEERLPKNAFEKCCMDYIELKRPVLSPSTIRGYQAQIRMMSDDFKRIDINDISQIEVQREISEHSKTHSGKSTHNFHGFISAVLSVYRPNLHLRTTLPQKVRFDAYTPSEKDIKSILKEVDNTKYSIAFQLGVMGLRRSEVCALEITDLDDNNMLSITKAKVKSDKETWVISPLTKTEQGRRKIFIPKDLADEIRDSGEIYDGDPSNLLKHLHRIQDKLNIPHFRFHDFRAFYASYCHSKGISDAVILKTGGWVSDSCMKKIYRRALEADEKKSLSKISSIFQ